MEGQYKPSRLRVFITIPNLNIAGAQKMVEQLINNINYDKFDVYLVIQGEPKNTVLEKSVKCSRATIKYLNKKPGFSIRPFFQSWRELSSFQPDIIHTHVQSWLYLIPWVLVHKVKVLHTIHSRPNRQESSLFRKIISYFYRKSKFIPVAISNQIAKEAEFVYRLPANKIEIVFNPVDFKLFSGHQRIPHTTFNFVMVARFDAVKNHLFLIDAFSKVCCEYSNVRLLLAGNGDLLQMANMKTTELGIEEYVEFLGVVDDIPGLLARSDVFVLPSLSEGLPLTLLEAEASGLPVIASNIGGIPDIVHENGFLVQVNDALKFKECMLQLAVNPQLCEKLGIKSKTIAQKYDSAMISLQYEGLYIKYAKRTK